MDKEIEVYAESDDNGILDAIAQLKSGQTPLFSTIEATDEESKLAIFDAVSDSLPLRDNLGVELDVAHIIVQPAEMENETTGKFETQPRVILITEGGQAYHAISKVLFRDVQNVLGIVGHPREWSKPLRIQVVREGSGNRMFLTLKRAKTAKK